MSENGMNSIFQKVGMILLVGAMTWLVNERELIMFFRQQDQKEMKEQHQLVLEAQRDFVILVEDKPQADDKDLSNTEAGKAGTPPQQSERQRQYIVDGEREENKSSEANLPEIKFLNRAARINLGLKPQEELLKISERSMQREIGDLKVFEIIGSKSKGEVGSGAFDNSNQNEHQINSASK